MSSKSIILLVRRHAGEIDWILPLLYKLKLKGYKIFTIFSEINSYTSLKDNNEIYNLWKKTSSSYQVIDNRSSILWRFFYKIILKSRIIKFDIIKKLEFFFLKKIFDIKNFEKSLKFKILDTKAIFVPSIHFSRLPILFKSYNKKLSIIRFPESSMIISTKQENPKLEFNNSFKNIDGDLFLFANKSDKDFFLGNKTKKNYYFCGSLRHEEWWIKKFLSKKKQSKNFNVLVPLRNPQKNYLSETSFEEILNSILKVLSKIKNVKITFKMHPQDRHLNIMHSILSKYKKNWTFKKNHMYKLSSEADVCVGMITSACMDSIAVGIPTIEYYDVKKELKRSPNLRGCVHMTLSKKSKKWLSIFNYKKLLKTVKNSHELENNLNLIYNKKYTNIQKSNIKNFKKLINVNQRSSEKLIKYLEKNFIK